MTTEYGVSYINKPKATQTALPSKYPQGYFKDKPCRECGKVFSPKAPSELYCSDKYKDIAITSRYLENNYGINYHDYKRMQEGQQYKCAICGSEGFVMDTSRHNLKLVVDHDHATGVVRGLLCHNCNRGLGLFHDSTADLKAAISYLERATTIPKGSTPKQVEAVGAVEGQS